MAPCGSWQGCRKWLKCADNINAPTGQLVLSVGKFIPCSLTELVCWAQYMGIHYLVPINVRMYSVCLIETRIPCSCDLLGQLVWFVMWGSVNTKPKKKSWWGQQTFLFSKSSRLAVGIGRAPGVEERGCEVNHSHPSSVEVKTEWRYTSATSMCLHRSMVMTNKI